MSNQTKATTEGILLTQDEYFKLAHECEAAKWERDELLAAGTKLLRGCKAALVYLADPPSKFASNRAEATKIIREAIAFAALTQVNRELAAIARAEGRAE